jgi:hypothetical protein
MAFPIQDFEIGFELFIIFKSLARHSSSHGSTMAMLPVERKIEITASTSLNFLDAYLFVEGFNAAAPF